MTQRTCVVLRSIASCSGSGHAVAHDRQKRDLLATKMLLKPCPSRKLLTILGTHKWQLSHTLNKASAPTSVSYRHEDNEAEKWSINDSICGVHVVPTKPACYLCGTYSWKNGKVQAWFSKSSTNSTPTPEPPSDIRQENDANLVAPRRAAATSSWSGSEHSRTAPNELTKSTGHLLTRSSARCPCLW